jgi:hypothetical protein
MVHHNCLYYPDSRTETCCHLSHDFTPLLLIASGGFGLVLGLCLGALAGSLGCCPPCQIPRGSTLVPVPLTGRRTSSYRRPLHTMRKRGFGTLCGGRGRERVTFHATAAERTAPHSPSQISEHCELKQLGFNAAYRARQSLLTSRNKFISILKAGILQSATELATRV